ncbi:polysaccharide deacetylase family protein [Paenibacillus sp. FSL H7-0331]|uniref:polysaccharide deacetylase family protein n=1 Tax=Paenibacillus sp. FSL H7-0331 TaxID=1920421 RepID=UPI00096F46B7|nr:polysaccharide deacetylase family protein [Paenibacillus sp. FSL H7-0331]OMF20673.1 xylanase deacetylase [Paenibacillus sp. FSL H7-0331]
MIKKTLMGLTAAALLASATACQSTTQPAASATPPTSSVSPAPTTPKPAENSNTPPVTPAEPAKPIQTAPGGTTPAPQTPSTPPAAVLPQATAKLYKLNPKSYDIVPIDSAAANKNVVLLTFDDGPKDKDMLEPLLETLDKHHAKAIFFVNGYRVKQKPELIKLITDHGHMIGNHSWDHIDLKKENKDKIDQQIGDVQKQITELTGNAPQFFRPPFGSGGDLVREKVKQENMLFMTWSNGSLDWEMTTKNNNPDKVVSNVLEQLRPGSNILMHELQWTVQAMDNLLTQLEQKNYGFVDPATIDTTL